MPGNENAKLQEGKQAETGFDCITPTIDLLKKDEYISKIFNSHNWLVDRSEIQGGDNIILQVHCNECGLREISIISDIQDSAKVAAENRQKESWK
jgi:hypothetical protein